MKYVIVSFLLLCLGLIGVLNPIRSVFQVVLAPIQFGISMSAFSVNDSFGFFDGVVKLRQENILLRQKNSELLQNIASIKTQALDQKAIQDQEQFQSNFVNYTMLPVMLMANPLDIAGGSVIISKGSSDRVRAGNALVLGKQLIGVVKTCELYQCYVELITSPSFSFTVYDIDTPSKTAGLGIGKHGSSVSMTRILQNEAISEGDLIFTSGKDGLLKPDLLIGRVVTVNNDPTQPLKSADINTSVDFSRVTKAFILLEK